MTGLNLDLGTGVDWFSERGLLGVKNETTPVRNFKISK